MSDGIDPKIRQADPVMGLTRPGAVVGSYKIGHDSRQSRPRGVSLHDGGGTGLFA